MTQELAEIIKRLREAHKLYEDSCKEISPNSNAYKTTADEHSYLSTNLRHMLVEHGLSTINALVQLVGEMDTLLEECHSAIYSGLTYSGEARNKMKDIESKLKKEGYGK